MAYKITISHDDLIDALEAKLGTVYENIAEGDTVLEVRVGYGQIEITLGNYTSEEEKE